MRSILQNPYTDPNSSMPSKFHKEPITYFSPTPLFIQQTRSPKIVNQIIYQPIQHSKTQLQYQNIVPHPVSHPTSYSQPSTDKQHSQLFSTIQQLLQKVKRYQQSEKQLKYKIQYLESQNLQLLRQIKMIQSTDQPTNNNTHMNILHTLQKQNQQLKKCNKNQQQQIQTLLSRLTQLSSLLKQKEKQTSNYSKQTTNLKLNHVKNIEQLQQQIQQFISQLEQRNLKQKDMQLAISNMTVENRMLNKYLKIKEGEIVENNEVKKSCEGRIRKLEKVIEELVKVKEGIDVINKIQSQFEELNISLSNMRQIIMSKENNIKLLKQEIEYYKNNIRVIISEKNDLSQNVKELTRIVEIEKSRNFIRECKRSKLKYKEEFEGKIKELVNQLGKLKCKIEQDARVYESQIKNILTKKEESDIEIASLSTNLNIKSMEVEDKYRIIGELEKQLSELKKQNKQINFELNNSKIDYQKINIESKHKTNQYQQIVRKLKFQHQTNLKQKLHSYTLKIQSLQYQLSKSHSRNNCQQQTILQTLNVSQSFSTNNEPRKSSIILNNTIPESTQDRLKLTQLKSSFYKDKIGHLERQIEVSFNANLSLKETVSRLLGEIEYLKKQVLSNNNIHSQLFNVQQQNIDSMEQINSLKNDLTKTNKVLLHKQLVLMATIDDLKLQINNRDMKIKELNGRITMTETEKQSMSKQLQISFSHSSRLSQEKFKLQFKLQSLTKQLQSKNSQITQSNIKIQRVEQCNTELSESISKLKIQMHMKVIELVGCKDELEVVKVMNKGLNDRIEVLSNQLISSSSNRMREIMEMHSNVQTMVASLQMFHSKDSSFD